MIPTTNLNNSFDQWRQNTNSVANSVGDLANIYATTGGADPTPMIAPTTVLAALNDLNARKLNVGSEGAVTDLIVSNTISFNGNVIRMLSTSLSGTSEQTLVSLGAKTAVRAAEVTIRASNGSDHQVSKLILLHNDVDSQLSEISILAMNQLVSTYTTTIDGANNVVISGIPQIAGTTTYEILILPLK